MLHDLNSFKSIDIAGELHILLLTIRFVIACCVNLINSNVHLRS